MTKARITITLEDHTRDWLKRSSEEKGKSQSEIIRICLREFISQNPNRFEPARSSNVTKKRVFED